MSLATITERQGWWDCWRAASFVWVGRDWRERLESVSSDGVVMAGKLAFPPAVLPAFRSYPAMKWRPWGHRESLVKELIPAFHSIPRIWKWKELSVEQSSSKWNAVFIFIFFLVLIKLLSDTYQTLQPKSCALSTCYGYPATHSEEGTIRAPTHSLVRLVKTEEVDWWLGEGRRRDLECMRKGKTVQSCCIPAFGLLFGFTAVCQV